MITIPDHLQSLIIESYMNIEGVQTYKVKDNDDFWKFVEYFRDSYDFYYRSTKDLYVIDYNEDKYIRIIY